MSTKRLTTKIQSEIRCELLAAVGCISDTDSIMERILRDGPHLHSYHQRRTLHVISSAINRLVEVRAIIASLKP